MYTQQTCPPVESTDNRAMTEIRESNRISSITPDSERLLAHGGGAALAGIGLLDLGLSDALGEDLSVLRLW